MPFGEYGVQLFEFTLLNAQPVVLYIDNKKGFGDVGR